MPKVRVHEQRFLPALTSAFPSTRYQGSKAKLVDWIWEQISDLDFETCLDAFGGTGCVAYRLKQEGKRVAYNDILRFNYYFGLALIQNNSATLASDETEWLMSKHPEINYPDFVSRTFSGIYFTDEENTWIDQTITNIRHLKDPYQSSIAFYALCQACIIKRPYNLFHRKNLYIRLANVRRSFGNKTTWDTPFEEWFRVFIQEANHAIFDNGQKNCAMNLDAVDVPGDYDLVYIDTPYISQKGLAVDYFWFYHFLEGLAMYDEWEGHVDWQSSHRRLKPRENEWTDRNSIHAAFDRLFQRFQKNTLVVSYRSDGIPSETELVSLLKQYKSHVRVVHYGQYKYVLSTNSDSREILIIGR